MQNLLILEKLIFLTQSASPCSIFIEPLRSLISGLRLKQFPKLFYSQLFRVLETKLFQALFSQRKISENDLKNSKQLVFFKTFLLVHMKK